MTRDEIIRVVQSKDDDWLESRWSVLDEAIKAIEPHLAGVEAAFDHDYTTAPDSPSLEKSVCDQVLGICNVVTTHDSEGTVSWGELLELINTEIERRERLDAARKLKGQPRSGVSMKLTPAAAEPSGMLSVDPEEISDLIFDCPECGDPVCSRQEKCPRCGEALPKTEIVS